MIYKLLGFLCMILYFIILIDRLSFQDFTLVIGVSCLSVVFTKLGKEGF